MKTKIAIVIPAREQSTRFPGKPLADILGKSMIQHVWEKSIKALPISDVYIATDSKKIQDACLAFGAKVIMTSESCLTGTDRVYEANIEINADLVINVQGDEPLIDPTDIIKVIERAKQMPGSIINAMTVIKGEEEFFSMTVPKAVIDLNDNLLYMSRAGIPSNKKQEFVKAFKQVCIYAFPKNILTHFYKLGKKTPMETLEDIEILRFLELGYKVSMIEVSEASIAVDTPEDLERVCLKLKEDNVSI